MNWEMVGALAELLGATGVILSLLYLARQMRESTREARKDRLREIQAEANDVARQIARDVDTADVWLRGLAGAVETAARLAGSLQLP